ncbi:MAG: hypothetical protein IT561_27490 [Alphaproteobacteria bacterium]|nr:hypothetical protein [Alphaproteobacteria bacterium]
MRASALAVVLSAVLLPADALPAGAQTTSVVEVESRGQQIRAILIVPERPVGSVVLLAGGHGRLDIAPEGRIGWGAGNQLVRTRRAYASAGYATLVPDIAPDMKTWDGGVVQGYRFNALHGRDIGALVARMRAIKAPVVLVGTSRGAVSAGVALAQAAGPTRPDGVALTAAMLMPAGDRQPNFQMAIGDAARARLPFLVVGHRRDTCRYTLPESIDRFVAWHGGKVDVTLLDGPAGSGDPCEARAAHGFVDIDDQVVATVTGWIRERVPGR